MHFHEYKLWARLTSASAAWQQMQDMREIEKDEIEKNTATL